VDDVTFGRALRAIRHRKGWTQSEVAARAGVQQSVVSLVERGHFEGMSVRSLRAICAALEVRLLFARPGAVARSIASSTRRTQRWKVPTRHSSGGMAGSPWWR
jgi:transcriptional regulator with XRE-family HTH domain